MNPEILLVPTDRQRGGLRQRSPAIAPRRSGLPFGLVLGAAAGLAMAVAARRPTYSFRGRTVIITGGSRGLGLVLAREFDDIGTKLQRAFRLPIVWADVVTGAIGSSA